MRGARRAACGLALGLTAVAFSSARIAVAASPSATTGDLTADAATAQGLYDAARTLMAQGHYAEACPKFEESLRLDHGLGTQFHLAECHEKVGRTATAWAEFLQVASLASAGGQKDREQVARARAAALETKVPRLVVSVGTSVSPGQIEIKRDGAVVTPPQWETPLPVDPGTHVISARGGGRAWETTVTLGPSNDTTRVSVPLASDGSFAGTHAIADGEPSRVAAGTDDASLDHTDSAPSGANGEKVGHTQQTLGLALAGVGVVAAGVGGVFGIESLSDNRDASAICPSGGKCSRDGADKWSMAVAEGNVATVAFIASGAFLVSGIVLFVTAPRASRPYARVLVAPGRIAIGSLF